jgi:hypothetical protein
VHAAAAAQLTSLSEDACSLSKLPCVSADFCYIQLPSVPITFNNGSGSYPSRDEGFTYF